MDSFFIEIIIRTEKAPALCRSDQVRSLGREDLMADLCPHMVFESPDKIVFNVPISWIGFKNGTIISMLREFGDSMYAALAYFSMYENEFVTDFEGRMVDAYDTIYKGQKTNKFVKKKLQIVKLIDKEQDIFSVQRYILDLKFTDPVLKVMDLYSDASNGGISSREFIK